MGKLIFLILFLIYCQHASAYNCKRKILGVKLTFSCPETGQPSSHKYCCGDKDQWCCSLPKRKNSGDTFIPGGEAYQKKGITYIIIGAIVTSAIVLYGLYQCCRRYKRRQQRETDYSSVATNPTQEGSHVTVVPPPPSSGVLQVPPPQPQPPPPPPGFALPGDNTSMPGYPLQPSCAPNPGYPPQPGFPQQPSYPIHPGYQQPTGYPYAPGPVPVNDPEPTRGVSDVRSDILLP